MRRSLFAVFACSALLAGSGCEAIREVTQNKTFSCDLRTSSVAESPQCWSFDGVREADGSALQVRGLCLGLQSELVKGDCPLDDNALVSCVAGGSLVPEEIQGLGVSLVITSYWDAENEENEDLQIEARKIACEEAGGRIEWSAN